MDTIAILCGVSRTLVYYFFWGRYNEMSKATQKRIEQAVRKTGYRPYANDEWFESRGRALLKEYGYDPDEVRDALRKLTAV